MDKAYIVANEQQEREVLGRLERWGAEWGRSKSKPTDFIPSYVEHTTKLPYALLFENNQISWCDIEALYEFDDIVYDGRKEEQMSEKYVVSQEFMSNLKNWKSDLMHYGKPGYFVGYMDIGGLPSCVHAWWEESISNEENNNRLIAILRWVNGEDVFEVEKLKKWVVRSKETDEDGDYHYVDLDNFKNLKSVSTIYGLDFATKFDAKEEAQSWANSHQEVVEVVDV